MKMTMVTRLVYILLVWRISYAFVTRTYRKVNGMAICGSKNPHNLDLDELLARAQAFEKQQEEELLTTLASEDHDEEEVDDGSELLIFEISPELDGARIDAALVSLLEGQQEETRPISRSFCGTLLTDKRVFVAEKENNDTVRMVITRKSHKLQAGQILQVLLPPPTPPITEILAQDLPLDILFEDEHMIVINKAANMVVHPAAGNWDGTVVNALAYYLTRTSPYGCGEFMQSANNNLDEVGENIFYRPGIVHRLDKGTTGVLVVAKTNEVLTTLSQAFANRNVKKTYLAVTVGNPGKRVKIDKPIGRHPIHRQKMRVVPDHQTGTPSAGRRALSYVQTLAFDGKLSLVQVRIETGRTHQIRVHLQDRHTPIYGDDIYGLPDWNKRLMQTSQIQRPLLHAFQLELEHPVTGEALTFQAPLPEDMIQIATNIYPQGIDERPEIFQS